MAILPSLSIGRSGLLSNQRALEVTGNNIANVNTPGYSRQRARLEPVPREQGYGVRVGVVERIVDRFLENRVADHQSSLDGSETRRDLLVRVEDSFPVSGPSISTALDDFFVSANQLATHPDDIAIREDFLGRARTLAGRIGGTADDLATLQREIDHRVNQTVSDVNGILESIAKVNREIATIERGEGEAGGLRDQRAALLGELNGKIAVRVVEGDKGQIDVFTRATGAALVLGEDARALGTEPGSTLGLDGQTLARVGTVGSAGDVIPVFGELGGSLGALIEVRDVDIPGRVGDLDRLAEALRDQVNAVHTDPTAADLDGLVGGPLFGGTGAATLSVEITDPRRVAASVGGGPGNNVNALNLAALRTTTVASLGDTTLGEFYGQVQAEVGGAVRAAEEAAEVESSIGSMLEAQRDAVSGVSLEEEFTNLIRFQRGFQASAQLISVSDRLLDDLLGLVR